LEQKQEEIDDWIEATRVKNLHGLGKVAHGASELVMLQKAARATLEWSYVLVQGGTAFAAHPVKSMKSLRSAMRAQLTPEFAAKGGWEGAFGEEFLSWQNQEISSHPYYEHMKTMDVYFLSAGRANLSKGSDLFQSRYADKIPYLVRPFTRSQVAYLNQLKFLVSVGMIEDAIAKGDTSEKTLKALGNMVNAETGIGVSSGKMRNLLYLAGHAIWSPQLATSGAKIALAQPLFWKGTPVSRAIILKEYVRGVAFLAGIYLLAALYNAATDSDDEDAWTVSLDWTSTDFLKLRWGQYRFGLPIGRAAAWVVFLARMITGTKTTPGGAKIPLSGPDMPYKGDTRGDVAKKFARGKVVPWLDTIMQLESGKDALGKDVTITRTLATSLAPIYSVGIYDRAVGNDTVPLKHAVPMTFVEFVGVNANDYSEGDISDLNASKTILEQDKALAKKNGTPFTKQVELSNLNRVTNLVKEINQLKKQRVADGKPFYDIDAYEVGVARWAQGRKQIDRFPNPITSNVNVPPDIQAVVAKHKADMAYAAASVKNFATVKPESVAEAKSAAAHLKAMRVDPLQAIQLLDNRLRSDAYKQGRTVKQDTITQWNRRLLNALR
jgi:hypothetical protein